MLAIAVSVVLAACSGLAWADSSAPRGGQLASGRTTSVEHPGDLERYAAGSADAYRAALAGFVWGAPLVTMSRTRAWLTCIAPPNRLLNVPRLSTPADRIVVAPNVDTLYSTAWLDLRSGPVVLGVPVVPDRYYVFQFLDMYTNTFADIGTRTTGQGPARFAVVGPGWRGRVPAGTHLLRAPSPDVWMLGRTLVRGPEDVANVLTIQRGYTLTAPAPASVTAPSPTAAAIPATGTGPDCAHLAKPEDLTSAGAAFFDELGRVMAADPPPARDRAVVRQLARAGIGPGLTPSRSTDPGVLDGLERGLAAGDALLNQQVADAPAPVGGWSANFDIGRYGTRYITRALVARTGLAANVPQEAIYYHAGQDAAGTPLDGRHSYRVHFAAGEFPPYDARGFWSLTMYDQQRFLVSNPINRYSVGDRTPGLVRNADGSLDIYIGAAAPAGHTSNWLPAPAARFSLTLRIYLPTAQVLTRAWQPPAVVQE
jgi:hypothetical protein